VNRVIVCITGRPGVGKSTAFFKIVEGLRNNGINVFGFYCPEVREQGKRIGFRIVDLVTGDSDWLAIVMDRVSTINIVPGRRIGRYIVNERCVQIAERALKALPPEPRVLAIDEIGPMELSIPKLRMLMLNAISREKNALLVIHRNLSDKEFLTLFRERNADVVVLNEHNRNYIPMQILEKFLESLRT